jgi:hypothetical protein
LKSEAGAHLATVVRLDPAREAAWKRLGCKLVGGRWVSEAQLAAEKAEAEAQKAADQHWRPLLTKWRTWLGNKEKQAEAERLLSEVRDPRAVPMVWTLFGAGDAAHQLVAVQLLGQIDAAPASRALTGLALSGRSAEVRRRATATLKWRDPRESAGLLVAMLRKPIKYEVRPVNGPGSLGVLFVEGQRFNVQRLYTAPGLPPGSEGVFREVDRFIESEWIRWNDEELRAGFRNSTGMTAEQLTQVAATHPAALPEFIAQARQNVPRGDRPPGDLSGFLTGELRSHPGKSTMFAEMSYNVAEARNAAAAAQLQLASDISTIEAYNRVVDQTNNQVRALLKDLSGQDLGEDNESWRKWWVDLQGYAYQSPPQPTENPTYTEFAVVRYTPEYIAPRIYPSCFGAGTLVRTLSGTKAIEKVQVGDRVLTQSVRTGALAYQPVLVVRRNPPSPTFRIKLAGETIVSSPFHRFWKLGQGWVMARELTPGVTLRLLDGLAAVEQVEPGPVQPVYNLDVADDHDFFAGACAALVHDNTVPELRQVAFDAAPSLPAVARPSR